MFPVLLFPVDITPEMTLHPSAIVGPIFQYLPEPPEIISTHPHNPPRYTTTHWQHALFIV